MLRFLLAFALLAAPARADVSEAVADQILPGYAALAESAAA